MWAAPQPHVVPPPEAQQWNPWETSAAPHVPVLVLPPRAVAASVPVVVPPPKAASVVVASPQAAVLKETCERLRAELRAKKQRLASPPPPRGSVAQTAVDLTSEDRVVVPPPKPDLKELCQSLRARLKAKNAEAALERADQAAGQTADDVIEALVTPSMPSSGPLPDELVKNKI